MNDNARIVPILRVPNAVTRWLSPGDCIFDKFGWMFVLNVTKNPPGDVCEFSAMAWEQRPDGSCDITHFKGVDRK